MNGLTINVREASSVPCQLGGVVGEVVAVQNGHITVRTGDGALMLTDFEIRSLHRWISRSLVVALLQVGQLLKQIKQHIE